MTRPSLPVHVEEDLSALADGALDSAERQRVVAHLAGCASCRAAEARLRAALGALARLPPPVPSPGFEQRFQARLARQREELRRPRGFRALLSWRFLAPLAAAGATAAALVALEVGERRELTRLAERLDLLESFEAVASLGDVADADAEVVAHLDQLGVRR